MISVQLFLHRGNNLFPSLFLDRINRMFKVLIPAIMLSRLKAIVFSRKLMTEMYFS